MVSNDKATAKTFLKELSFNNPFQIITNHWGFERSQALKILKEKLQ